VGKYTLGAVTVAESVNRHVLEGHHIEIYLLVVLVRSVVVGGELTELFDLFLELQIGLVKELLKRGNFFLVDHHLLMGLFLIDGEVQTELFEDLDGAQCLCLSQLSCHLTRAVSEDLELFAFNQVLEMSTLTNKFLEEGATTLNKLGIFVVCHLHVLNVHSEGDFLGDGRNVAAGPAKDKLLLE